MSDDPHTSENAWGGDNEARKSKDCMDVGTVSSVLEVHVAFVFSTVGEFVCIYSLCEYISNIDDISGWTVYLS